MSRHTNDLPDILRLNLPGLAKVDPNDEDSLSMLWNIFSKCGQTIENGRRLENMSWRLWNRELFSGEWNQPRRLTLHQLSQLFDLVSVSMSSDKPPKPKPPSPVPAPPPPRQQEQPVPTPLADSSQERQPSPPAPNRSRAPSLFQKAKKTPMQPTTNNPHPIDSKSYRDHVDSDDYTSSDFPSESEGEYGDEEDDADDGVADDDDEEEGEDRRFGYKNRSGTSTSIVRGFDPSNVSVVNRSPSSMNNANKTESSSGTSNTNKMDSKPTAAPNMTKAPIPREKMFFIESSPSDSEDQPNVNDSVSTNEDKNSYFMKNHSTNNPHKPSSLSKSFSSKGGTKTKESFPSSRDRYEEAVEDDEDSDWDSVDDESDSSFDEETVFTRDDEKQKKPLTKPSLLSSLFLNNPELLQQQQRQRLQKQQRQPPSILQSKLNPTEKLLNATAKTHAPPPAIAMSPRTTRRNMLASELSESLRRNLLWERQQSNAYTLSSPGATVTDNNEEVENDDPVGLGSEDGQASGLKKSHTSTDISNYRPNRGGARLPRNKSAAILNDNVTGTWREDMEDSNLDFNYHARGW